MLLELLNIYKNNLLEFQKINENIENNGVSFFGAGSYAIEVAEYFSKLGCKIKCFIDNDDNKIGNKIKDVDIVSKESIINTPILITSQIQIEEIKKDIYNNFKFKSITFDKWFVMKNFNELINSINFFDDELSKNTFITILYSKLIENPYKLYTVYQSDQYFCLYNFIKNDNEIFLDAGAFVGDTIEKFININDGFFKKIYAFEPGVKQFNALKSRISRIKKEWAFEDKDNIILMNTGLSDKSKKAYLKYTISGLSGTKTTSDKTDNTIDVYSIDSFLNGNPITFLKSDTEGEELNILKGAKETITKYKPKMAISVYHKPYDLLTIPQFIKELVPEYKFSLRHHSKSFSETVLYCWTDQIRSDQIRSDQIRSDQIRSDQIRIIFKYQIKNLA